VVHIESKMPLTCGILTGITFQSGISYYKKIYDKYALLRGKKGETEQALNPFLLMASIDCERYARLLTVEKDFAKADDHVCNGVQYLLNAGINFLVIASNTGNMSVPAVKKKWPLLKVLHITDCTATAIKNKNMSKVGLLGTSLTMGPFSAVIPRLKEHGIEVLIPAAVETGEIFDRYIMDEFSHGIFKQETREVFLAHIEKLCSRGAEGIILGCTEFELLVRQEDTKVSLFPTAALHIECIARILAGESKLAEYEPCIAKL